MPDITALIMDDHEWFRRRFAQLDDASTPADLDAVWQPLAERVGSTPTQKKPSSTLTCVNEAMSTARKPGTR